MGRMLGNKARLALVALLAAGAIGAGAAFATIPDGNGVIHGCYQRSNGVLRVVDTGSGECRPSEAALDWNVQGPPGPPTPPPANWTFVHPTDLAAGSPTEVARMDVGAGTWVFSATVHTADTPLGGAAGSPHTVGCNLIGSGGSASIGPDAPLAEIPVLWVGTMPDTTTVKLECIDRGSDDDRVTGGTLTAIQVTPPA